MTRRHCGSNPCERWGQHPVNATDAPAHAHTDHDETLVTSFEAVRRALLSYDIFPPSSFRATVCSSDGRIQEGCLLVQHVHIGPFWLESAVRVVRFWDEGHEGQRRTGFSYATLTGHPERGVATFEVAQLTPPAASEDARPAVFRMTSWSVPGTWWSCLGRPAARSVQRRFTRQALLRMAELAA